MIDTNFVELHSLMFHAKFQNHRPPGSEKEVFKMFAIYSHGGHLGHVTMTIYVNFHSLFLRMLHIKFCFDWPRTCSNILVICMYIDPGQGQTTP